ncbi:phage tail protein [Sphingobium sp. SCG-1]|uniref:phage tail protein n=1 Tax=Sphingobium sp. SCG-1 TaxID=2072936 RepID=UPI000CD6B857|nr:phage tail protein [Sphingobium sp. SCG-1]AUW59447.1 phage tail protein [Sphingobium sp. SCG-1]
MKKLDSLRAFVTAALPEIARSPELLTIHAANGKLAMRHGPNLGWEYRYRLVMTVFDYAQAPESLFLPVLLWLRVNQPELLLNHDTGAQAINFVVDALDNGMVDIELQIDLTEAVDVQPREDGTGYDMTIRDELPITGTEPLDGVDPITLLKRIYADGALLVGYPDATP